MADGFPLQIIEEGGQRRTLALGDSARPAQGVTTGSTLRTVKTLYPGNQAASIQALGVEEDDEVFEGHLRDTWLGGAGEARRYRAELRALLRGQQPLQVLWGSTINFIGMLTGAAFTFDRASDIRYRLTFQVASTFDAETVASEPFAETVAEDVAGEVDDAEAAVADVYVALSLLNEVQGVI